MKGKYEFLKSIQFQIYELMVEVESTDIDKTDIILIRLRQVIEKIVKKLIEINNINNRRELYKNIELLKENDIIPKKIQEYFYDIRANGNKAVHEGYKDIALSKELIQKAYYILVWFSVNYGGLEIDNVELEKMNANERVVFYEVLF